MLMKKMSYIIRYYLRVCSLQIQHNLRRKTNQQHRDILHQSPLYFIMIILQNREKKKKLNFGTFNIGSNIFPTFSASFLHEQLFPQCLSNIFVFFYNQTVYFQKISNSTVLQLKRSTKSCPKVTRHKNHLMHL